jgi:biopolymer transport protein ExbB/TolQ
MKDIAAFRGLIMMSLLLISMYLVFSTVMSTFTAQKERELSKEDEWQAYQKMIEQFEILPPNVENADDSEAQSEESLTLIDKVEQQQLAEQDAEDRELARAELMKSIKNAEANRLLENIAKPLIEKEDIRLDTTFPVPEDLPLNAADLLGQPTDDAN